MPSNLCTYLKLALVSMIWGGTFVAGRVLASGLDPLLLGSLRFTLASLVLLIFLILKQRLVRVNTVQALQIAGLGFSGIYAYTLFFFHGLHYTDASRASLIVATNPAVMALVAYLCFRQRLGRAQLLGVALCLLGAAAVVLAKAPGAIGQSNWIGDALIFGCVLSWVIFSVFCTRLVKQIGALPTVTYAVFAGAAMLGVHALINGSLSMSALRLLSSRDLASLVYLGALGSALAYVLYYDAISTIGATRAGSFIALNPLTAVVVGALLLGERLTTPMLLGGALVILGILLINLVRATVN
ncbi:DMT family transporter [Pseudomonas rubra]|uniref:DMT family transporter n=1 Tax=Pseudomonas rubra TaxID=2942627 RepID=A0ABT5P915_9PSED|nr:DMT family transporter [Pseudomonas rubra]MDD1014768.1 DMT family transporter [Pseudomonas rubra]MDD1040783.1 DMT family transporter [Pseudomonas rubra]MDD1157687.1 DMT family transporter [Pseudomonas rubra]